MGYTFEEIKNETEEATIGELLAQLEDPANEDICKCNECVLDMACHALNQLKPRYRVSLLGIMHTRAATCGEYHGEIEKTVSEAIRKIGENPGH